MKRLKLYASILITTLAACLLGAAPVSAQNISVGGPSDCDDNAIIRCGAHSTTELMNAYNGNTYVQAVYRDFGIHSSTMQSFADTTMAGRVTKDGNVYVDGQSQPVATGAMTGGRQNMAGSTRVSSGGAVYYRRPPSVSFAQQSLPAFVSMSNGRFQYAILASCGNAVSAAPTTPKPAPTPKPTPAPQQPAPTPTPPAAPSQPQTQSQSQSQSQTVTVTPPPAPTPAPTPAPATPTATVLPNTGPAGIGALFALSTGSGIALYRRHLRRRLED